LGIDDLWQDHGGTYVVTRPIAGGSLESLSASKGVRSSEKTLDWWRRFNDPVLDRLVDQALRANPNVRTAGLRIMEARAQLGIAGSSL